MRPEVSPAHCAEDHFARFLNGHWEANHWRCTCPVCHRPRALEVTPKTASVAWNCHTDPPCDHARIRVALAELPPCRAASREPAERRAMRVLRQVEQLVLDEDASRAAIRLRLACAVWDMSPQDAAAKLGYSRSLYYRAVANLPRGDQ